jgi:hypothetical protein
MNKKEIAEKLREEIGHLEVAIKKTQDRCERLKQFCLDLEEEIAIAEGTIPKPDAAPSKFRKVVDSVFGETPKQRKR